MRNLFVDIVPEGSEILKFVDQVEHFILDVEKSIEETSKTVVKNVESTADAVSTAYDNGKKTFNDTVESTFVIYKNVVHSAEEFIENPSESLQNFVRGKNNNVDVPNTVVDSNEFVKSSVDNVVFDKKSSAVENDVSSNGIENEKPLLIDDESIVVDDKIEPLEKVVHVGSEDIITANAVQILDSEGKISEKVAANFADVPKGNGDSVSEVSATVVQIGTVTHEIDTDQSHALASDALNASETVKVAELKSYVPLEKAENDLIDTNIAAENSFKVEASNVELSENDSVIDISEGSLLSDSANDSIEIVQNIADETVEIIEKDNLDIVLVEPSMFEIRKFDDAESPNPETTVENMVTSMKAIDEQLNSCRVPDSSQARRSVEELVKEMKQVAIDLYKLSWKNQKEAELMETRKVVQKLAKYLESLDEDERTRINTALLDQTNFFTEQLILLKKMAQDAIFNNIEQLTTTFNNKFAQDREATELLIVQKLNEQAAAFKESLESDLTKQAEELNAYWKKELKASVDKEKDGRIARLDALTLKLKYLEQISIETSTHLSRQIDVIQLSNCVRSLNRKLEASKTNLKNEMDLLQKLSKNDPLVSTILSSIDLKNYTTREDLVNMYHGIKDELYSNQLLPLENGPISYVISKLMVNLLVKKKGYVPGNDTNATLARIEYFIQKGDLESASREGNSLKGWSRLLADDWLKGLRGYLTIKQAIDILDTRVRLQELGVLY
jgi:hypothetical protein